ncbi:putative bifunctional diguanylate cyclase/phosphodiesterase [Sphingomonas oligoaromativorans]|uniref:putative bifunctional diguanylate cyclase/phosphodiesterase n=1 Tax=Sphingomonas oligoaromativorans TaxID=575322 RepID=UPI001420267E|nr:EAL domain-containing protein [Sphingomonas oligoaromativorans]NIJ33509.1 diguanylate cyclase (GGDEF)-like protein [Sphingomonas oligoaromativorans]
MSDQQGELHSADGAMIRARRDLVVGGVLVAAILVLVLSGWRFIGFAQRLLGHGNDATQLAAGDRLLLSGLLLNLALILFGWRRYRDLAAATTQHDLAAARAMTLARIDELTGFLNRRAMASDGEALITQARRQGKATALLTIDLDHFKAVNEVHGHLAGDTVLRAATDIIRRALPASAVAGRLDGDEFAALLPFDPRHAGAIDSIADYIVSALAQPLIARGVTAHIGASIGIARSDEDCQTVEALLRRANIAMQAAKGSGRGRHAWFDTSMERELISRNMIEAGLREGIPIGQFVPYYEPQVDLETNALLGFEVLARWEHPTRGVIAPDNFIPVAEECGLISELSIAVMRRAFIEGRDWSPSLSLSVNISPAQLRDPWLAQKIVKLLVETGFPANRLEIEITESSLFQNLPLAQSIVGSLKNQGIRLALDDFGTGYSSLAHLRALPFDRIKIDRSFVTSINKDPESAAIVNAISKLGESLNLPITAEGIEDGDIRDRLRAMGCHKGQGWHFGKPMTVTATRRMLAERGLLPTARGSQPIDDHGLSARRA